MVQVETAEEMWREVMVRAPGCSVVVMAAAVADFTPPAESSEKIKRAGRERLELELLPTRDILKQVVKERRAGQVVVGFAAETGDVMKKAGSKLREKAVDILVANDVTAHGSGFDSDNNRAALFFKGGRVVELDLMPKSDLASRIWEEVAELLEASSQERSIK